MKAIRLIIAAAAAAFAGLLIADNRGDSPKYHVTVLNHGIGTVSTLDAFIAGLVLALLFGLAMGLGFGGRSRR
ncbi:hypothetical protein [Streptacidiphilus fuscans]|uniref:Uncharacterized protein n=1 Tax=Streptacidiphilus fuscans TaxID=2789292 RepID=A0A931AZW6_9ACTN|nr:hypothetical protein [Streptacidiphilus fuscans]MBF9068590.1 hypothetical protein [Streptacidiphilus fuscans]